MSFLSLVSLAVLLSQAAGQARLEGNVFRIGTVQPVSGARVSLLRSTDPKNAPRQPIRSVVADEHGKYVFQGLDEGSYDVQVQANGYLAAGSSVELSKGEVIRDMSIGLTAVATLTGRLRDPQGQPLVNVPVQLLRSTYDYQGQHVYKSVGVVQTNDRGEFRMYWVTPGRYYLLAGPPPGAANPMAALMAASLDGITASGNPVPPISGYAFYPGVTDFSNAQIIELAPGSEFHADLIVTPYPKTFSIRGKLLDSRTGQRPPRASVFVLTTIPAGDSNQNPSETPNANYNVATGTINVRNLLPGIYTLAAIAGDLSAPGQTGLPSQSVGTMQVSVMDSDVDGVVLSVAPAGSISGRLRIDGQLPSNTPITDFQVVATALGPHAAIQRALEDKGFAFFMEGNPVNADGTFRIPNLAPGDYRVEVLAQGRIRLSSIGYIYLKDARFEGTDVFDAPLHFSGTSSTGLDLVVAAGGGHINGTVTDARSQPMPNTQVVLIPDRGRNRPELYRVTATDEKGVFNISTVAPDDYKIFAWESIEEFGWFDPAELLRSEARGTPVHVSPTTAQTVNVRVITADSIR